MPVHIETKPEEGDSFVRFLEHELDAQYPEVDNIIFMTISADIKGEPYRVVAKSNEGRGVKFFPGAEKGTPFMVAEFVNKPNTGTLNLTPLMEIPDWIQVLIDKFMVLHADYDLTINLLPKPEPETAPEPKSND